MEINGTSIGFRIYFAMTGDDIPKVFWSVHLRTAHAGQIHTRATHTADNWHPESSYPDSQCREQIIPGQLTRAGLIVSEHFVATFVGGLIVAGTCLWSGPSAT